MNKIGRMKRLYNNVPMFVRNLRDRALAIQSARKFLNANPLTFGGLHRDTFQVRMWISDAVPPADQDDFDILVQMEDYYTVEVNDFCLGGNGIIYRCTDATPGALVWEAITGSGGGGNPAAIIYTGGGNNSMYSLSASPPVPGNAIAIGNGAQATATGATALGETSSAIGEAGIGIGRYSNGQGDYGVAIGAFAVSGITSVAIGNLAVNPLATDAISLGRGALVTSNYGSALGPVANVEAYSGTAVGHSASVGASAPGGLAAGSQSGVAANASYAVALGANSLAQDPYCVAIGLNSLVGANDLSGQHGIGIGVDVTVDGSESVGIGHNVTVNNDNEVQIGNGNGDAITLDSNGVLIVSDFRLNKAPVAETPSATHTITINLNGTDYKLLALAA